MASITEITKVAENAARKAGEFLTERLGKVKEIQKKSSSADLVTDIDFATQELIVDTIQEKFPSHSILAEEGDAIDSGDKIWIIDPLDGTTNYVHGYPAYSVSIAYEEDGEVLAGVVHDPSLEETFTAILGEGATLNGETLHVSPTEALADSLLATGFPYEQSKMDRALEYFNKMARKSRGIRRGGSAAIDLSYLAMGRLDGFWEANLHSWDLAAGKLMVEEAGGLVSDLEGVGYDIHSEGYIVASNGRVHEELLSTLRR